MDFINTFRLFSSNESPILGATAWETFGRLDVVIANAGFWVIHPHFHGVTLSRGSLTSGHIAITSFLRVTGRTLFAAVPGENVQRQADQQRHIDAKHLGLGSAAHKTFHAGFIDRKNLFQKNHGRFFKRPQRFSMPKPVQSLSSIRRRSTAGNSLRSMRPTLNCTGLHKRKCALCWAGQSSPKWMC